MTLTLKWANGTCTGDLTQVASLVTAITQKKPWTQTTRKRDGLAVWQKWDESEQLTSVGDPTIADDLAELLADHLGVPQDEVTIKPDPRDSSQLTASELRARRLRAHLSKKDLAAMCGVNEYTVRNWEQGVRTVIPTRLLRIFQCLDSYREEAHAAVHAEAVRRAGNKDALAQADFTGYAVYAPNDHAYATLWPDAAISADMWRDVIIECGRFRSVASDYEARLMGLDLITIEPPRKGKP
jgi:transcriptional regulator with XRE-family HTH domain